MNSKSWKPRAIGRAASRVRNSYAAFARELRGGFSVDTGCWFGVFFKTLADFLAVLCGLGGVVHGLKSTATCSRDSTLTISLQVVDACSQFTVHLIAVDGMSQWCSHQHAQNQDANKLQATSHYDWWEKLVKITLLQINWEKSERKGLSEFGIRRPYAFIVARR